jgi:hypothetical protein
MEDKKLHFCSKQSHFTGRFPHKFVRYHLIHMEIISHDQDMPDFTDTMYLTLSNNTLQMADSSYNFKCT